MKYQVRLFAVARQLAQQDLLEFEGPESLTVGQLRALILANAPQLSEILPHVRFAINAAYVADSAIANPDDEIACIPPVSGG